MKLTTTITALAVASTMAAQGGVIVNTLPADDRAGLNPDVGQTFTTGPLGAESALFTIEIEGPEDNPHGEPMNPYMLELWTDTDGDHRTWDPGTLLGRSDSQSLAMGGATVTTYTFSSAPTLSDNAVYAVTFTNGASARGFVRAGLTGANSIADGTLFASGRQTFNDKLDLAMRITSKVDIPEPAAAALLFGVGGLAMAVLRRRHHR